MRYFLGIDAGNTKTIALVAQADGTIFGAGRSGCGDIYGARTAAHALDAIDTAVSLALAQAKVQRQNLSATALSAAGADWPEDFAFLREQLARRALSDVAVYNDAIGALRAGSPDGTGVVVACGTGAATGARNAKGEIWHSSFWQLVGGAGELGDKLLREVYAADMQMAPPTALTAALLAHFQMDTVEQVLHALTRRDSAADYESRFIHPKTGGLARVLLDVAEHGDAVARHIVRAHGAKLGAHVVVAARKVGLLGQPLSLVLAGGVMHHPSPLLREALAQQVQPHVPELRVYPSAFEPALGALMLALEQRQPIDGAVTARLQRSQPSPAFFAT